MLIYLNGGYAIHMVSLAKTGLITAVCDLFTSPSCQLTLINKHFLQPPPVFDYQLTLINKHFLHSCHSGVLGQEIKCRCL